MGRDDIYAYKDVQGRLPLHYIVQWQPTLGILTGYTECPGRNVPDFGGMFLKLKYTAITQNTYIQR